MTVEQLVTTCRRLLVLHGVDSTDAAELAEALFQAPQATVEAGEVLCREDRKGDDFWILVQGAVRVTRRDFTGEEHLLCSLDAPTLLGHMSLIHGAARTATCTMAGPGRVLVLDRARLAVLMEEIGPAGDLFRRLLISSLSSQLARGNAELRRLIDDPKAEPTARDLTGASADYAGWRR